MHDTVESRTLWDLTIHEEFTIQHINCIEDTSITVHIHNWKKKHLYITNS